MSTSVKQQVQRIIEETAALPPGERAEHLRQVASLLGRYAELENERASFQRSLESADESATSTNGTTHRAPKASDGEDALKRYLRRGKRGKTPSATKAAKAVLALVGPRDLKGIAEELETRGFALPDGGADTLRGCLYPAKKAGELETEDRVYSFASADMKKEFLREELGMP